MSQQFKDERSLGDLFTALAGETGTLVRQEVALAQAELTQKASNVGKNVAYLVVGGAVSFAALLVLLASIVMVLSTMMPAWAASLAVAVIVGIVAFTMVSSGLANLKKIDIAPRESVESLKEDAQWLKNQVN